MSFYEVLFWAATVSGIVYISTRVGLDVYTIVLAIIILFFATLIWAGRRATPSVNIVQPPDDEDSVKEMWGDA